MRARSSPAAAPRDLDVAAALRVIRGERVILDADLARIYGVATRVLNQGVKRNRNRFPPDFVFALSRAEQAELNRSQPVMGSQKHRDPRYVPYAFTEHGAVMAANILNSARAVQMSVFVVRAFVRMRAALGDARVLGDRLAALESELKKRLDIHESVIVDILQRVMTLLEPPADNPLPQRRIGFGAGPEDGSGRRRSRLKQGAHT